MTSHSLAHNIGNTPLIELVHLSRLTGCQIFGKAEFLNPGGSIKDRTALGMLQAAQARGELKEGTEVFEGTAGNTGIGIAMLASQFNYKCTIVMPDNQAQEKYETLKALGARLIKVAPVPFANPNHFYHTAKSLAAQTPNSFWCNQFENLDNYSIHYRTTGPEIWQQMENKVDHFVASSGTGGSLAGISNYLKEKSKDIQVTLVDPFGSGLYEHFHTGEIKTEGSSITEGIGIMRLTENYKKAKVDQALRVSDTEMISMLYYLSQKEGILVGTSAALNVFAAFQIAKQYKNSGRRIVTLLCDSALRYQSKIFNPQWLNEKKLHPDLNLLN